MKWLSFMGLDGFLLRPRHANLVQGWRKRGVMASEILRKYCAFRVERALL